MLGKEHKNLSASASEMFFLLATGALLIGLNRLVPSGDILKGFLLVINIAFSVFIIAKTVDEILSLWYRIRDAKSRVP